MRFGFPNMNSSRIIRPGLPTAAPLRSRKSVAHWPVPPGGLKPASWDGGKAEWEKPMDTLW